MLVPVERFEVIGAATESLVTLGAERPGALVTGFLSVGWLRTVLPAEEDFETGEVTDGDVLVRGAGLTEVRGAGVDGIVGAGAEDTEGARVTEDGALDTE